MFVVQTEWQVHTSQGGYDEIWKVSRGLLGCLLPYLHMHEVGEEETMTKKGSSRQWSPESQGLLVVLHMSSPRECVAQFHRLWILTFYSSLRRLTPLLPQ